jgi:hypothetical protein
LSELHGDKKVILVAGDAGSWYEEAMFIVRKDQPVPKNDAVKFRAALAGLIHLGLITGCGVFAGYLLFSFYG